MRIVVLTESWPATDVPVVTAPEVARTVSEAWKATVADAVVEAFALGDGGARSADALPGARSAVGGAQVVDAGGSLVLTPADGARRWEPHALAAALLGLAAEHVHAVPSRTVVVPVGDESPAGDATDVWLGGLAQMRAATSVLDLVVAVGSQRPLLGFHGMSAALRDGRESDEAIGRAAQAQEERWALIAREADPLAAQRSLLGSSRLSDQPGTGAAGGLAYCLAALGGRLLPAAQILASLSGAEAAAEHADLVVAVVPRLLPRTLDEGAVPAASALAARTGVPAVILAPSTRIGRRDLMNAGVASAHEATTGLDGLRQGVRRVAQTWSRRP
ncbi:glycerate kinase [Demequina activiva]|uniref:Glycerate kinase n=1 Tax=Demequina activiva TaxID=1582364 RepID=A0A919Q3G4_9MICO|nr:glycerate kinase [Demequina activiva]GIG55582.1 hypothetical protein Dac01nite_23340 [Demequina activiva]